MDSQGKEKKRPLPSWMKAVSKQNKDVSNVSTKTSSTVSNALNTSKPKTEDSKCSVSDIIAQSMPFLTFNGPITYSFQDSDCACICLDIISSLSERVKTPIGFDMEWPVSYQKGVKDKTSLIQMCVDDQCYLFHVSAMISMPKSLLKLILDPRVVLVGLNIDNDLWKLARDFDINVKPIFDRHNVIDVAKLANAKLKSCEKWSLEGLCRNVLQRRLNKDEGIRCGNWSEFPLNKEQKIYAATDAYAGLLLYQHLIGLENK